MKPNRFKQVLAEGRIPCGHMLLEFVTRGIPFMLEEAGADFVLIDMEHTGFGMKDLADVLAWFKKSGPRYQSRMNAVLRSYMNARSGITTRRRAQAIVISTVR